MAPSEVPQVCFLAPFTHCKYKFQRLWVNHKGCQWCLVHWKKNSVHDEDYLFPCDSHFIKVCTTCAEFKNVLNRVWITNSWPPRSYQRRESHSVAAFIVSRASGGRSALAPVNPVQVQRVSSKALCWQRAGKLIVWSAQWRGDWRKKGRR